VSLNARWPTEQACCLYSKWLASPSYRDGESWISGLRHDDRRTSEGRIEIYAERGDDDQELAAHAELIATSHAGVTTIVAVCLPSAGIMMQATRMPLFTGRNLWLTTGLWMSVPLLCLSSRRAGDEISRVCTIEAIFGVCS
jgi:hypothetical protein